MRRHGYTGPNPALETFWRWRERIQAHQDGEPGVVWDIETPGLDPGGRTLCVGWKQGGVSAVHWGNMLETAGPFLERLTPGQLLVAHNLKFEAGSLRARGIDAYQFVWWDTMLGEWVLLANNPKGLSIGLDESAQRYGCEPKDPEVDAMLKAGRSVEVPPDRLIARNRKDVEDTAHIFQQQLARMTEAQIRLTIVRSMEALELTYIEPRGMGLDREAVKREVDRNAAEIREHEDALREITKGANPRSVHEMAPVLYGIWPANLPEDARYQWTVGCACPPAKRPKKVPHVCPTCQTPDIRGELLVESLGFKEPTDRGKPIRNKPSKAWPDGAPSIAKETMELLASKARTPRQRTWAKHYAALCEAISERDKNLRYFEEVCTKGDGIVYAELHQGVAATHRLTCRAKKDPRYQYGCQLQNVPRHLKGLLVPKREDYRAASVDQSQAEFRGAVFLTDDQQGRHDIEDETFDAHIQTLTVMLHGEYVREQYLDLFTRYKAGDKEVVWQRADNKLCKGHTFAPLFGGAGDSERERAYYKWFKVHYSGVTEEQDRWDQEVALSGRYVAPTGMEFHWDRRWTTDWKGRSRMVNHHGRSLYSIVRNLPIQYFATGELAMVSTLCLLHEARRARLRYECVMLVHDDTSGEVHKDDEAGFHAACAVSYGAQTHEFLRSVYDINYDVELAAESKVGLRFGSGSKSEHAYSYPFTDEDETRMKIAAKQTGPKVASIPEDTHVARLCALVDLGIQKGSDKYPKPKRKVFLSFEFPNVIKTWKDDKGVESKYPARVSKWMALSMHEKASFRKLVEGLLGRRLTDKEASELDLQTLLATPCMIPASHKVVGNDVYVELGMPSKVPSVIPLDSIPQLAKPAMFYDTDAHDELVFKALPEFLQQKINARIIPQAGKSSSVAPLAGGLPDMGSDNGDGEIPF